MTDSFLIEYVDGVDLYREDLDAAVHVGTPVVAWELVGNGQLVPGWADLTFANVTPATTADITVSRPSANYVEHGKIVTGVPLTGTAGAWQEGIVRGVRFKFNDAAGFLNTWKTRFHLGAWLGGFRAGNPDGTTFLQDAGYGLPGLQTGQGVGATLAEERWKITNTSGKRAFTVFAKLIPTALGKPTSGKGLSYVRNTAKLCVEKASLTGGKPILPYLITFADYNATPTPDTISMLVDGALVASGVLEVSSGALTSSANLKVGTLYRFTSGDLSGIEFMIDVAAANTDTYSLYVYGVRWNEITPVNGSGVAVARPNDGVEDGTTWGVSDVGLTEIGQPTREVAAGGVVHLRRRTRIPLGADYGKNPVLSQGFVVEAALSTASGY